MEQAIINSKIPVLILIKSEADLEYNRGVNSSFSLSKFSGPVGLSVLKTLTYEVLIEFPQMRVMCLF